jgi:hypothetical protein
VAVIERVNAALAAGEIRNAVPRDPSTGKPVTPPTTSAAVFPQTTLAPGVPAGFGGPR